MPQIIRSDDCDPPFLMLIFPMRAKDYITIQRIV